MSSTSSTRTFCNPLNLEYRFQVRQDGVPCRREAADPSVIMYRGRHWLFASKSGGYWYSDDLLKWRFVATDTLPTEDYAPDVRVINDWLYCTASRRESPCPVYRTQNPEHGKWECVGSHMIYWDPNLFQDDDGRVYLYYGCSNNDPIYAVELDPATMAPKTAPVTVIPNHQQTKCGWLRGGDDNRTMNPPWLEGAWMTKHNGRYYLQYAGPGTEYNVYNDGVSVGDRPLGPFRTAAHNPFSIKPGGFSAGAGHGSTFQDRHGNWWHASTMCVTVHHNFERRLGIWPAGFDQDGILFCNTRFGDYPTRVPQGTWNPWNDTGPEWMLLSLRKPVTVSSALADHPAENAVDESIRTWWTAADDDPASWLQVDLETPATVNAVQINFAEDQCEQDCRKGAPLHHQYLLEASLDGAEWGTLIDKRQNAEDVPHEYIELDSTSQARYLRLTITHMPAQGKPAVRGLRIFGRAEGAAPAVPVNLAVDRDTDDPCRVDLRWSPVPEADGYNVRWGIAPDKLYSDWLVLDGNELTMRCLHAEQDYWFRVEAFNAAGISAASDMQRASHEFQKRANS